MVRQINQPRRNPRLPSPRYSYTQQPVAMNPLPMFSQITTALNTVQQVSALLSNPMVQALMPMLLGGGNQPAQLPAAGFQQQKN